MSQSLISKHLRALRECGLVQVQIRAQRRIYCLNAEPLVEIDEWLNAYRKMWNKHVDALAEHLDQKKSMGGNHIMSSNISENPYLIQEDEIRILVLERFLEHPIKDVWAALTKAEQIPNWGPFTADRDLTTTGAVLLTHINAPSYAAGWNLCLKGLAGTLAGEKMPSMAGENALKYEWQELYEQYSKQFGKNN